ncbi:MAG: phosphodiester glycosidase family protein [Candidatus Shapirobacteria bacterium]
MEKAKTRFRSFWLPVFGVFMLLATFWLSLSKIYQKLQNLQNTNTDLNQQILVNNQQIAKNNETAKNIQAENETLKNEDLRQTNGSVKKEIQDLKTSFKTTLTSYEEILDLQDRGSKITSLQSKFSSVLSFLAKDDLASAQKTATELSAEITKEKTKLASLAAAPIPANVPEINQAPASGYRRQKVTIGDSSYMVSIVSADLNSTKVIVDTASDGTCANNCPVLPLATYVSRSGAYAGINGSYFCPETYPSCADKKNSFDTLLMNKNKVYFNSDNNVYSTVPVAIFSGNSGRFIGQSSGWGRDTGADAVIANRPLLVLDGNIMFGGGSDQKESAKGNRSFLGSSGNIGYIGVVHNSTVAECAKVLQAMGIKNAINLDSGGSTALWHGGYKLGPGRNLPNVVLFVKK